MRADRRKAPVWHLLARVGGGEAAALAVLAIVETQAAASSAFETGEQEWCVEAYPTMPLLAPPLTASLAVAAVAAGGALIDVNEEKLAERDWLAENQLAFPPLRIGRFFVYGSHYDGAVPAGTIGIRVDAATAFGTGEHPSTRGCLAALETLTRWRRWRGGLDIGTGTGILAIAAAKLLHRPVQASDLDAGAVRVARQNVAVNGVAGLVRLTAAPGYRGCSRRCRHELILSNILARPLALMAPDLARALAPGGRAVLSGLLRRQEAIVLAAHRGHGIVLDHRIVIDGWSTLILRRRARYAPAEMTKGAEAPSRVKPPSAGSVFRDVRAAPSAAGPRSLHRRCCGSASGGHRYRRARDHRDPSIRHRPAAAGASSRWPDRLKRKQ